jgi:opacity protein-like surface antigen
MRKPVLLFCVLLFVYFATSVSAQVGKFGIGVHGKWVRSATQADEREWIWGLHARARLISRLALEGSLDFQSEQVESATVKLYPIQFSALIYLLPTSGAGLYGILGMGWTRVSVEGNFFGEGIEDSKISYHGGFGLEIPLGGGSTFYADIRYLNLDLNISNILIPNFDSKGWQANIGYTFYF